MNDTSLDKTKRIESLTYEFPGYSQVVLKSGRVLTIGSQGIQFYHSEKSMYAGETSLGGDDIGGDHEFPEDGWEAYDAYSLTENYDLVMYENGYALQVGEVMVKGNQILCEAVLHEDAKRGGMLSLTRPRCHFQWREETS